jgi:hypothetical protein
MRVHFRVPALLAALAAALATTLSGCGGSPVTPRPVPTPTPTPAPVTTLLSEGSQSGLEERFLTMVPFRTSSFGTIRASVDWTFEASTIYVYISAGRCTIDEINAGGCRFVAASQTATPKPRLVTALGQPAGEYALYIGNFAGEEESVSWQVFHTSSASSTDAAPATLPAPEAPSVRWRR